MKEIIIIGGGASGMMCAITAARNPENRITLIERQARVGRKLLSTGNGRCNLTNTDACVRNYHGEDVRFAEGILARYPSEYVLNEFASFGLMTVTEYGGRVYPLSNQANSVLDVLRLALEKDNITLLTGVCVEEVRKKGAKFSVRWAEGSLEADKVVIACGGCAGSKLGGVMDGYNILKSLGHSRTALYPALTQIRTDPTYPKSLKGVKADAALKIVSGKKIIAENAGEVLFADNGISGTAVFEISRAVSSNGGENMTAVLDFYREYSQEQVKNYVNQRRTAMSTSPANTVLTGSVHNRLGQMLCKYAGIGADKTAGELSKADISSLAAACKDFRLKITGVSGFESAQVTAGGVKTSEFSHETLESKLVKGLYACGEVLDIDGDCGGYNLQWAWASGMAVGESL